MTYRPTQIFALGDPVTDGNRQSGQFARWMAHLRSLIRQVDGLSVSWTPANVAANTTAEQTVTVTGAKADAVYFVNPPGHTNGVLVGAGRVTADDTVAVPFANVTAGALAPPSGTYKFVLIRP